MLFTVGAALHQVQMDDVLPGSIHPRHSSVKTKASFLPRFIDFFVNLSSG